MLSLQQIDKQWKTFPYLKMIRFTFKNNLHGSSGDKTF